MNVPAGPWTATAASETEPYMVVGQYVIANDLPVEDAYLIAAAPDLYAALERMLGPAGYADDNSITRQAKAALAKARGELKG